MLDKNGKKFNPKAKKNSIGRQVTKSLSTIKKSEIKPIQKVQKTESADRRQFGIEIDRKTANELIKRFATRCNDGFNKRNPFMNVIRYSLNLPIKFPIVGYTTTDSFFGKKRISAKYNLGIGSAQIHSSFDLNGNKYVLIGNLEKR